MFIYVAEDIFIALIRAWFIGQNSENPTATGRIEIVVKPCHMYQYSYGVVIF